MLSLMGVVITSLNGRGQLTGPIGMPKAILMSSDRSPGFLSLRRVSNSLPYSVCT